MNIAHLIHRFPPAIGGGAAGWRGVGRHPAARRADLIHLHHCPVPLSFWGLAVARLTRRPVVVTPHFHPGDPFYEQRASRWLLRRCDVVITVTPYEASLLELRGVPASRV